MEYLRPDKLEAAFKALETGASILAGGTDWYPLRGVGPLPDDVLDITELPDFRGVSRGHHGWRIGAATTWSDIIAADLPPAFDGLKAAAREVGAIQIQNAGTIGGNLCNASPAADGVPPLLTLDAQVELLSKTGCRTLPVSDFITGVRQTALRSGELLGAVILPDPGRSRGSFIKLGARDYLVISIAMVAARVRLDGVHIAEVQVAVGACSAVAQRLPELEIALQGARADDFAMRITPAHLAPLAPISDARGSAAYRLDAALDLIRRVVREAAHD